MFTIKDDLFRGVGEIFFFDREDLRFMRQSNPNLRRVLLENIKPIRIDGRKYWPSYAGIEDDFWQESEASRLARWHPLAPEVKAARFYKVDWDNWAA